ncbi:hypothetical protein EIP91_003976 [Steccherinum ochraceum]|uniref:Uncharacterized protein n=1 Tax=Steccherinum ochraceum TaxID=92696 RepID=A0A4R0RL60_9APHY|nr:hypothetical protein EIP91_003976 [Steccherinum ochraceum]
MTSEYAVISHKLQQQAKKDWHVAVETIKAQIVSNQRELVPKPPRKPASVSCVYPPGSRQESLLQQMGEYNEDFRAFTLFVRENAKKFLDLNELWNNQQKQNIAKFHKACMDYPLLRRFEDAWPLDTYATMYVDQAHYHQYHAAKSDPVVVPNPGRKSDKSKTLNVTEVSAKISSKRKQTRPQASTLPRIILSSTTPPQKKKQKVVPVVELQRLPRRSSKTSESLEVLKFLRSLKPSQEPLYTTFIEAGVVNQQYLRALAQNAKARTLFLAKLERDGKLKCVQSALLEDGLASTYRCS